MNWNRLKNMQCPSCNKELVEKSNSYACSDMETCKFIIGKAKFESIIVSLYKPKHMQTEEDNLSDLNNL